jgi:hypothetical protein
MPAVDASRMELWTRIRSAKHVHIKLKMALEEFVRPVGFFSINNFKQTYITGLECGQPVMRF